MEAPVLKIANILCQRTSREAGKFLKNLELTVLQEAAGTIASLSAVFRLFISAHNLLAEYNLIKAFRDLNLFDVVTGNGL